ncbi:MAG: iron-sulfur cluster assembly scaffold protein [Thermodesulfobacteriota bacterium]
MNDHINNEKRQAGQTTPQTNPGDSIEVAFHRWLDSLQAKEPMNPDGQAILTGKCGETIAIFLNFEGERVKEATYLTNGCISSKVCAALAAQMAKGRTPDEILEITGDSIMEKLEGFPKEEDHCAFLAAETLQEALHRYMLKQGKS